MLERAGGARVVLESEASAENLYALIRELLSDRSKLDEMGERMRMLSVDNASEVIADIVLSLARP